MLHTSLKMPAVGGKCLFTRIVASLEHLTTIAVTLQTLPHQRTHPPDSTKCMHTCRTHPTYCTPLNTIWGLLREANYATVALLGDGTYPDAVGDMLDNVHPQRVDHDINQLPHSQVCCGHPLGGIHSQQGIPLPALIRVPG